MIVAAWPAGAASRSVGAGGGAPRGEGGPAGEGCIPGVVEPVPGGPARGGAGRLGAADGAATFGGAAGAGALVPITGVIPTSLTLSALIAPPPTWSPGRAGRESRCDGLAV